MPVSPATADWTFDSHSTSRQSEAWYDTHTGAPTHGDRATRMTVEMQRADFGPAASWKQLKNGVGYVQLCLTQGEEGPAGTGFAAFDDWVNVKAK